MIFDLDVPQLQRYKRHNSALRLDCKMGTGKKEAARKVRQGKTGDGMNNVKVKGENFYR
jgi:hypothetical protein